MKTELDKIPSAVRERLKHYVYLYIDPRTERVFYVGKGSGNRALEHLRDAANPAVREAVRRIREAGLKVRIDILKHGLNPRQATEAEAAAIEAYGLQTLKNAVRGHLGDTGGRARLPDLVRYYEPHTARPEQSCILIRINQTYEPGMSALELYEATRGIWRIDVERARNIRYALAVYDQSVLEAYEIARASNGDSIWLPAGSTAYFTRFQDEDLRSSRSQRSEFVGSPVKGPLRKRLIGKVPQSIFPKGSQNPITYWERE